jgi:glycosyltransferase involved in cell wall biosynthesis
MTVGVIRKVVHLTPDAAATHLYNVQLVAHLRELGVHVQTVPRKLFLKEILELQPDVVHIHWLHPFIQTQADWSTWLSSLFRILVLVFQLAIISAKGIKIVWTVHELEIPESRYPQLDRLCIRLVIALAHAVLTHCNDAQRQVINTYCSTAAWKVKVVPHGHFMDRVENRVSRSEARQFLNISRSDFVLLFFGTVRPYKGVAKLVQAHSQLGRSDVQLLIVGPSLLYRTQCLGYVAAIQDFMQRLDNARLVLKWIDDSDIQIYMNASDVVVFPYLSIMTSGALIMAMGFGKPCIASRIGCIGETLDDRGAFLYEPGDQGGLLNAIKTCLECVDRLPQMGEHNRQLAQKLDWYRVASLTLAAYEGCVEKRTT